MFSNYKWVWWITALLGLLGLVVSMILAIEGIEILKNPGYIPSCSISSVFSCSTVMKSPEAAVFGFSNALLGIMGYTAVFVFAACMVIFNINKKVLLGLFHIGALVAAGFSYWLLSASVFRIGTLCPYCLASCFAATNIFFLITLYNLKFNIFGFSENIYKSVNIFISKGYYAAFWLLWHAVVIGYIMYKFHLLG